MSNLRAAVRKQLETAAHTNDFLAELMKSKEAASLQVASIQATADLVKLFEKTFTKPDLRDWSAPDEFRYLIRENMFTVVDKLKTMKWEPRNVSAKNTSFGEGMLKVGSTTFEVTVERERDGTKVSVFNVTYNNLKKGR